MITLLPLVLSAFFEAASIPSAAAFVGTWKFVSEVDRHADGTEAHLTPAAGYDGLLVYTANGYVTAQTSPRGRTWTATSVTPEELRTSFDLSASYFGTYELNAADSEITHRIIAALDPSGANWDDKKAFTLSGDRLMLKGSTEVRGETIRYEISWQRVR